MLTKTDVFDVRIIVSYIKPGEACEYMYKVASNTHDDAEDIGKRVHKEKFAYHRVDYSIASLTGETLWI